MPRMPGIYRIDVQQGNVISQEQLAALERGMEKQRVRFILGTPLVADAFHPDRWDYYYSLDRRGEERVQRLISVFFEDDRLVRVTGGVRPATGPIVVETRRDELVPVPEGYRDDGLLAAITPGFLSQRAKRRPRPEAAASDAGPVPAPTDGTPASPASPAVELGAEDERYLRELLDGFGRGEQSAGAAPPVAGDGAPGAVSAASTGSAERDEGILSRWARRLGLKDEEPPAGASARD